jgi:hypothetical protein
VNQFGAELIFKGGDLLADGGLTNATFLCDRGEAPFFNYSDENLQRIEFVHRRLRVPRWNTFYPRRNDSVARCPFEEQWARIPFSRPSCIPVGNSWHSPTYRRSHVNINRKGRTRYRAVRVAAAQRSRRGWLRMVQVCHHVREGRQGGFRRGQSD